MISIVRFIFLVFSFLEMSILYCSKSCCIFSFAFGALASFSIWLVRSLLYSIELVHISDHCFLVNHNRVFQVPFWTNFFLTLSLYVLVSCHFLIIVFIPERAEKNVLICPFVVCAYSMYRSM